MLPQVVEVHFYMYFISGSRVAVDVAIVWLSCGSRVACEFFVQAVEGQNLATLAMALPPVTP